MKPTRTVIAVNHLVAGYDDTPILENVSFEVFRGEIFIIIGGSGCGKSTLLKHLIGLIPPISGDIHILGENLTRSSGRKRNLILKKIGVAFQSGALFGSMTIMENIKLPLKEYTDLSESMMNDIAMLKLAAVGLEDSAALLPSELSGGMKKRAALARAMALDPDMIFLDEPSAGLDPVTSVELDHLIIRLSRNLGITFVIVTHELDSIKTIADRLIMLEKKTKGIIATGTYDQLRKNKNRPQVYNFFNRISSRTDTR